MTERRQAAPTVKFVDEYFNGEQGMGNSALSVGLVTGLKKQLGMKPHQSLEFNSG